MAKYLSQEGLAYFWTKIKEHVAAGLTGKADSATTLAGYGIADAYTKTEVDEAIAGAGGGSAAISATTLSASKWSSGQYSFESAYPVSTYDIEVAVNSTATSAQLTAYKNAMLTGSATSNVLTAKGVVPTVDIPIILKAVKK